MITGKHFQFAFENGKILADFDAKTAEIPLNQKS